MKQEDLCECGHREELISLRQRVEDQRNELARLNSLVDELRSTFILQSGACRRIMAKATKDMNMWSSLMESAEKDFSKSPSTARKA